jgi:alpha-D-ribose 1-methylphosphonate 5-triphosphate synthase subunit PhnH
VIDFCRERGLDFILGVAPTTTLRRHIEELEASTKARFEAGAKTAKLRRFKAFFDGAKSMPKRSTWRVAQFDTLRLRVIKMAARVVEMKTQIQLQLPTNCPYQPILRAVIGRLPRLLN